MDIAEFAEDDDRLHAKAIVCYAKLAVLYNCEVSMNLLLLTVHWAAQLEGSTRLQALIEEIKAKGAELDFLRAVEVIGEDSCDFPDSLQEALGMPPLKLRPAA